MRSLARLGWAVGAGLVVGVAAVAVVRRAVRGGWGPTAWAALADPQWGPLSQILGGVAGALLAGLLTWWAGSWLQRRQRRDEHRDREAEADQERRALLAGSAWWTPGRVRCRGSAPSAIPSGWACTRLRG
jgi:hypothetical protein